jgi:hypothetical protein
VHARGVHHRCTSKAGVAAARVRWSPRDSSGTRSSRSMAWILPRAARETSLAAAMSELRSVLAAGITAGTSSQTCDRAAAMLVKHI